MPSPKVAILASGSGTTAEAFIESVANKELDAEIVRLICNNKEAAVFGKVEKLNQKYRLSIKTIHIGRSDYPAADDETIEDGHQSIAEEQAILKELKEAKVDLVLLLGYMKLIGPSIVKEFGWQKDYNSIYQGRMINTHPGLLPETKGFYGIHVQEEVLSAGHQRAGHCLFIVNDEYDAGPVIIEHEVEIEDDDTPDELFEKVKASEKANLTRDIKNFLLEQKKYLELK